MFISKEEKRDIKQKLESLEFEVRQLRDLVWNIRYAHDRLLSHLELKEVKHGINLVPVPAGPPSPVDSNDYAAYNQQAGVRP